jgi:hypothetical protein
MTRNDNITVCWDVMPHSQAECYHCLGGNVAYMFRAEEAQKTSTFTSYKTLTYLADTNQEQTAC